jgi:hypothetical protein
VCIVKYIEKANFKKAISDQQSDFIEKDWEQDWEKDWEKDWEQD